MRGRRITTLLGIVLLAAPPIGRAGVEVTEGRVTASFDAAPARQALLEIAEAADVEIHAPEAALGQALTLRLEGAPLDEAMRQVFRSLGVVNHAVVFDEASGRRRYVVLERGRELTAIVPEGAVRRGRKVPLSVDPVPDEDEDRTLEPASPEGVAEWTDRMNAWNASVPREFGDRSITRKAEGGDGTGRHGNGGPGRRERRSAGGGRDQP